ncbi:T9SS type A sorting domain-containing protein [candidate division KSB1 bacterium]|nr:T9SS type A sorting domain-containing protein [candidate division KSB1 bacterium]NIR73150.1 T9SS type A sorting domain-containing protein [candidate division KSB1 bacterium]NIS23853.1 T9SS type A sorting domain-containing protein [candidate division KSB1 bacterium]NIT70774.1 T9SS type A sorting domain-containing protein [candidate division KSB1 bacterium]NIU24502.1 T9SS type A sorting domain-containing protein [candidate division KSB1 bacterium]
MKGRIFRIVLMGVLFLGFVMIGYKAVWGDSYNFQDPNCFVDVGYSAGQGTMPGYPITISIGVLLVEFNDRQHHSNNYTVTDFENLIFSDDYYSIDIDPFRTSPDGEAVYGSLKDWYQENSHGLIQISGDVINPDNNGVPIWLNMETNFATYNSSNFDTRDLIEDAVSRAVNDSSWNAKYNVITVIVAGDGYRNVAWHGSPNIGGATFFRLREDSLPSATNLFDWNILWGGYTTMERWQGDLTSQSNTFTHVGPHAHESFHVIGHGLFGRWYDQNLSIAPMGDWCIMHRLGIGPNRKGECPSHLDAARKISVGWATPTEVTSNNMEETIDYVETQIDNANFDFYRFTDPASGEEFVIENRQYSGFNRFMPAWWEEGTTPLGGLLVFNAVEDLPSFNDVDNIIIIPADNFFTTNYNQQNDPDQWSVGDPGDPFPGTSGNTAFTPFTTPNTDNRSGDPTGFAITNISNSSNSMTATFDFDILPPAAPQNLVIANPSEDGANPILQWDANTEPDLDHYLVWRGTTPNWKTTPITWETSPAANVTVTTWTDNETFIDLDVLSATYYRVTAVDDANNESDYSNTTSTTSSNIHKAGVGEEKEERTTAIPIAFALHQNFPNPFNPQTEIRFELPAANHVTLEIYNVLGEKIRTLTERNLTAGFHAASWDGKDDRGQNVPSGLYIYRMVVTSRDNGDAVFSQTKKLTLLR